MAGHSRSVPALAAWAMTFVLAGASGCTATHTASVSTPAHDAGSIQRLVDDLKGRLPIPEDVTVMIVRSNPLLVSAESHTDRPGTFVLRLDARFLDGLTPGDLEAVLAHELGHIWIFTHHPYLQTEALANRIAMRLVTRERLVGVYEKVWKRSGDKGDLVGFLGLASAGTSAAGLPARPN